MGQSPYKCPRKPTVLSSAHKYDASNKVELKSLVLSIYELTGRRPYKGDFTPYTYAKIFKKGGNLSKLLEEAGIGDLEDLRFWREKELGYIKERKEEYQRKYIREHREKRRAYARKSYHKHKTEDKLKILNEKSKLRNKMKKENSTNFCPVCDKKIMETSKMCRRCNVIKSNRKL